MRRDLVFYYERPVEMVFDAFVQAAKQKFGKESRLDPPKTLNFALNYSFKYNMNGGSVTAHFMPHQNGTAVDLRYTIVQAFGARYKAHAQDLTTFVNQLLQTNGQLINLDINLFLAYEQSTPTVEARPQPPVAAQASAPTPAPASTQPSNNPGTCPNCGKVNLPDSKFCAGCGTKLAVENTPLVCRNCGKPIGANDMFCMNCGQKTN